MLIHCVYLHFYFPSSHDHSRSKRPDFIYLSTASVYCTPIPDKHLSCLARLHPREGPCSYCVCYFLSIYIPGSARVAMSPFAFRLDRRGYATCMHAQLVSRISEAAAAACTYRGILCNNWRVGVDVCLLTITHDER